MRCLVRRHPDPSDPPEDPRTLLTARVGSFRAACDARAAKAKRRHWGNKITTEQVLALEEHNRLNPDAPRDVLGYFFGEAFADVKIIFLLRDGRTCVRSKMARAGRTAENACAAWSYSVRVYQYLSVPGNAPAGVFLARFEDLLRDTAGTLEAMCRFVGVAYEPGMLAGTASPRLIPVYRREGIEPERAEIPAEPEPWYALIEDDLRATNYL